MKALIIGGDGFIGRNLVKVFQNAGIAADATTRQPLIDDRIYMRHLELIDCVVNGAPDYLGEYDSVINCAGMAGYGVCQQSRLTYLCNVDAPRVLADAALHFVHLSSDAVEFALNTAYGHQKALTETALLLRHNCLVLRLARVTPENVDRICHRIKGHAVARNTGLICLS
jgi:dTDP-4-dehydrorhamnose reductase